MLHMLIDVVEGLRSEINSHHQQISTQLIKVEERLENHSSKCLCQNNVPVTPSFTSASMVNMDNIPLPSNAGSCLTNANCAFQRQGNINRSGQTKA